MTNSHGAGPSGGSPHTPAVPDWGAASVILHEQLKGKIQIVGKAPVDGMVPLSLLYSPGVAEPCLEIARDPQRARDLTWKGNTIAIISDGSAVLGLGNIGALAGLPVMEGKALLFREFGGVDAVPLVLDTQDTEELIRMVRALAPNFSGINLEDISAPRCFEIESRLQDIGIPVFHDDQHGTAIVVAAGLINAARVLGKPIGSMRVVVSGAGAAGIAIAKLLTAEAPAGTDHQGGLEAVADLTLCDSKGAIHAGRTDLNATKQAALSYTNCEGCEGTLRDVIDQADVFIGVSAPNLLGRDEIRRMADDPIVFACSNPDPEVDPIEAKAGGAAIVGTGRSDYPNQINNVLAFPGIFRGAIDALAPRITEAMKRAAAHALADVVSEPSRDEIIPAPFDRRVAPTVARAVYEAAQREFRTS